MVLLDCETGRTWKFFDGGSLRRRFLRSSDLGQMAGPRIHRRRLRLTCVKVGPWPRRASRADSTVNAGAHLSCADLPGAGRPTANRQPAKRAPTSVAQGHHAHPVRRAMRLLAPAVKRSKRWPHGNLDLLYSEMHRS